MTIGQCFLRCPTWVPMMPLEHRYHPYLQDESGFISLSSKPLPIVLDQKEDLGMLCLTPHLPKQMSIYADYLPFTYLSL